jgi:hypothetical protein
MDIECSACIQEKWKAKSIYRFQRFEMPIANMLVDAATGHKVINFLDGSAGYN